MIDYNLTEHETGINKEYFIKFPKSHRLVYKVCDKCKNGKWIKYNQNKQSLCKSCSLTGRSLSEEHKQNISKSMKKDK